VREYLRLTKEGQSHEDVCKQLTERFEITDRVLDNVLNKRCNLMGAKATALTDAHILVRFEAMMHDIEEISERFDTDLDIVDAQEEDGVEFVDQEQTIADAPNGTTTTVKKLAISEQRNKILQRKLALHQDIFNALRASTQGKNPIINIMNSMGNLSQYTDEDLEDRINEAKRKNKSQRGND